MHSFILATLIASQNGTESSYGKYKNLRRMSDVCGVVKHKYYIEVMCEIEGIRRSGFCETVPNFNHISRNLSLIV